MKCRMDPCWLQFTVLCNVISSVVVVAANLNVVFKPECSIKKEVRDQVLYLRCQVEAFPPNVTYYWYHNENLISCKCIVKLLLSILIVTFYT